VGLATAAGTLPAEAQVRRESGVAVLAIGSEPVQWLAGASHWWRVARRTRAGGLLAAGVAGGEAAARGEVAAHFLLNPAARRGAGWYGGGGLAGVAGRAEGVRVQVVLGVDGRPAGPAGWSLELGVGGGVRLAAGYRWRVLRPR